MADIWAKIGGAVKKGARATKDVFFLVPKALIYPIKKPFASWGETKHDAKVSLKEAVGMDVPEKEKKYDPPIETTEASKNLGVEIISYKDGKIKFLASRTLTGDIPYLTPEQLDKIKELNLNKENKHSSIAVFKEENKVVIEVDVEKITKKIKDASEHKGKSPEEIKKLVIEGIYGEVDRNLKGLAKITGGEFKVHTDRKLLYGIAEKLYREYDSQDKSAEAEKSPEQPSETVVPSHKKQQLPETKLIEPASNKKSSEQLSKIAVPKKPSNTLESLEPNEVITQNNMTNPWEMYHVKAKKTTFKDTELPQHIENQVRKFTSNETRNFLRFEGNASNNETKEPSSTPFVKEQEKRGK
ncbi:hypothetical protein [Wolbachia pipientis]|uniref:hypothetical protein n=1 Tax=Wolbachia pipientis TaxID=955 RepID=UPI00202ECE6B|nr:hypothetical protein [Wolbachia pipientis]MCM1001988.1 hypothetical protein [Wolbachia pipientis]